MTNAPESISPASHPAGRFTSGRAFVIGLALVVLLVWGGLYLGFRSWKAGYDRRAAEGRAAAARIRPLVDAAPPGFEPWVWEDTVDHAEAMLIALTGSNLLSEAQIRDLSVQIDTLTSTARDDPSRSVALLRAFWDEMALRAGPVADIYGRPDAIRAMPK